MGKHFIVAVLLGLVLAAAGVAEEIRIATYNIENWRYRFDVRELLAWAKTQPKSEELDNLIRSERNQDDEDNWEIAETIKHPKLNPDVLVFQEGCSQEDLDAFNKKWLGGAYATAKVFPNNSGRGQTIGVLVKEGFKVLETKDQYHKEIDTVAKDWLKESEEDPSDAMKENRLFARGPAFVKVQSPGGYTFWVGTNHQKSKSGNDVNVSAWRLREAKRTNEILTELAKDGTDVVFGGDMNDELGYQEFEQQAGGDATAALVGTDGQMILATRKIAESAEISFGGYMRDRYRSFIDQFVVSKSLANRIVSVSVFKEGMAPAASDHYPVLLVIKAK